MAKKRSFYENEYTRQVEEAVFDQQGYDAKKLQQKKMVMAENQRHKGLVRVFMFLCLLGFTVGAYHLINLDKDNAGPIVVFLVLIGMVYQLVRWINK